MRNNDLLHSNCSHGNLVLLSSTARQLFAKSPAADLTIVSLDGSLTQTLWISTALRSDGRYKLGL